MSYPKKLLRLRPTKGFVSDTPPYELGPDYWSGASNVIFRDGFASRIKGSRDAYGPALTIVNPGQLMHAVNCVISDTNYWLLFEDNGEAWAIEGGNATQIDAALLASEDRPFRHSSELLNGLPIYSNGKDEPVYWAGANLITLPGWTATESCAFITVFKFHIFALNISGPGGVFPNLLKWSDAAAPGTVPASWTPAAGNEAGSVELSDAPGELVCAYPLRDSLIIYKRSSMYSAQYIGGNNVFAFRKVQSASGALTARSVCDVNGRHLVVSDGDIILTDGTTRQSIGESRVKDYLFNQLDQNNYRNVFCTYNRARDEVLIGFPTAGNTFANLALVYDVNTDSFGVRDLVNVVHAPVGIVDDTTDSNVWADRTDNWVDASDIWAGSAVDNARDSIIHIRAASLRQQDTNDNVAEAASVGKHGLTFGEPERIKFVKRVHVRADKGYGNLLIRVGAQMTPNGVTQWSNEVTITDPDQIVNLFAQGRYISFEARSTGSEPWRITGVDIEAELRGYH